VVQDDGQGIPEELLDRIFEPFFTTKAQGKGSGMGLSVVHGIVQTHKGQIFVQSLPGQGARFEVWLPAVTEDQERGETVQSSPAMGSERILYVDDERALGLMMNRMLTSLGYEINVCDNPTRALAMVQDQPLAFDLVITDLTMPQMTGLVLAEKLLQIRTDLPVLLCTGYGDQIEENKCREVGIVELIHKPVSKMELATVIRRALHPN
jgi:CheY-like chemotaxis protein